MIDAIEWAGWAIGLGGTVLAVWLWWEWSRRRKLPEDEALKLGVRETRAVRRERAAKKSSAQTGGRA